jgi:murein DD-endopeptidase MepM/ murein hydrolase activator NlpD
MDRRDSIPPRSVRQNAVTALFPGLGGTAFCEINLGEEALRWRAQSPERFVGGANPLLDPAVCQTMVGDLHARLEVDWSYGGYLEDRRHLWQGSYLERTGDFVHLGVDFHVPQGTPVAAPRAAAVFLVDDDHDRDGGWGQRVFLRLHGAPPDDPVLIFAHLQEIRVKPGTGLPCGAVFAEVGGPPDNGNWAPHLHLQTIPSEFLVEVFVERFAELDGYGPPSRIEDLRVRFPDPLPVIGWR